jgi:hypothetical protein
MNSGVLLLMKHLKHFLVGVDLNWKVSNNVGGYDSVLELLSTAAIHRIDT